MEGVIPQLICAGCRFSRRLTGAESSAILLKVRLFLKILNRDTRVFPLYPSRPKHNPLAGLTRRHVASEKKLERELDQPRIARLRDSAKVHAVRDVAVRGLELRMIHDIEKFPAEFQASLLGKLCLLLHSHIKITDSGPATNRPR